MRFKSKIVTIYCIIGLLGTLFLSVPIHSFPGLDSGVQAKNSKDNIPEKSLGSHHPALFEFIDGTIQYYEVKTDFGSLQFYQSKVLINLFGDEILLSFPGSQEVSPIGIDLVDYHQTIIRDGLVIENDMFYEKLVYENLYPGISLEYKLISNQIKYEFIVQPYVDYSQIKLLYDSESIEVQDDSITITKGENILNDNDLFVFHKNDDKVINAMYNHDLQSNQISYNLDNVDPSQIIVIDPIYEAFSTYYGGIGDDKGIAIDYADYNDVWIGGRSSRADFSDKRDYIEPNEDSFVVRYNEDYTRLKNTFLLQGNGVDWLYDLVVSPTDKIILLFYTTSTDLSVTDDLTTEGNNEAIYIVRLSPGGFFLSSTLIDNNGLDVAYSVKVDSLSRIIIAGETNSTNLSESTNKLSNFAVGMNGFLMILSQTASSILHTLIFGGSNYDKISEFEITEEDEIILIMQSYSSNLPGTKTYYPSTVDPFSSSQDVHVIRLDNHLDVVFDIKFGGSSIDYGTDITLDDLGNIIVVGYTFSSDFPIINAYQSTLGSYYDDVYFSTDGFIMRFSGDGEEIHLSTYVGGKYFDRILAVETDSHNYINFVGNTQSPNLETIGNVQHEYNPDLCIPEEFPQSDVLYPCEDIMIGQLTYDGNATVLSYYGSPEKYDTASQLYIDEGDHFKLIGWTEGTNFPTYYGMNDSFIGGNSDVVIVYFTYVFLKPGDNPLSGNPVKAFWKMVNSFRDALPHINFTGIIVLTAIVLGTRKLIYSKFYNKNKEIGTEMYPTKTSEGNKLRVRPINIMK